MPFERIYWVCPGKLLASAYPGASDGSLAIGNLQDLLFNGITLVLNLMEETEGEKKGPAFVEYGPTLEKLAATAGRSIRQVRFPIPDASVPTRPQMRTILDAIRAEIDANGIVHVHCWGGKGRTGTVVGCVLLEVRMAETNTVMQKLRTLVGDSTSFGKTPETDEQIAFVMKWGQSITGAK